MTTVSPTRTGARREEALGELRTAFKGVLTAVRRLRGRQARRPGELSFAQYHLLFGLAEHGTLSTSELAATAELAPATVTQMLDNLDALHLVERTRSTSDRRIVNCTLTPRGLELLEELRADVDRLWQHALAEFTTAELATAAAVVDRLRGVYEQLDDLR